MLHKLEDKIGNPKSLHKGRLGLVELCLSESGPGLEEISDEGGLLLVQHGHGLALLAHLLRQQSVLVLEATDLSLEVLWLAVVVGDAGTSCASHCEVDAHGK